MLATPGTSARRAQLHHVATWTVPGHLKAQAGQCTINILYLICKHMSLINTNRWHTHSVMYWMLSI